MMKNSQIFKNISNIYVSIKNISISTKVTSQWQQIWVSKNHKIFMTKGLCKHIDAKKWKIINIFCSFSSFFSAYIYEIWLFAYVKASYIFHVRNSWFKKKCKKKRADEMDECSNTTECNISYCHFSPLFLSLYSFFIQKPTRFFFFLSFLEIFP